MRRRTTLAQLAWILAVLLRLTHLTKKHPDWSRASNSAVKDVGILQPEPCGQHTTCMFLLQLVSHAAFL